MISSVSSMSGDAVGSVLIVVLLLLLCLGALIASKRIIRETKEEEEETKRLAEIKSEKEKIQKIGRDQQFLLFLQKIETVQSRQDIVRELQMLNLSAYERVNFINILNKNINEIELKNMSYIYDFFSKVDEIETLEKQKDKFEIELSKTTDIVSRREFLTNINQLTHEIISAKKELYSEEIESVYNKHRYKYRGKLL